MESNESALTERQAQAIPVIVSAKSIAEAADMLDINPKTIFAWLQQPQFKEALDVARKQVVEDAINRLKGLTAKAVETLGALMDRVECPAVQRSACNDVLNHLARFTQMEELDERLRAIEKQLKTQGVISGY